MNNIDGKPIVPFSHNWNNKLDNIIFTTIRKYSPQKLEYYRGNIGKEHEIRLKGKVKCLSTLLQVYKFNSLKMVSPILLKLDTGLMAMEDILKLFKKFGVGEKDPVIIPLFYNTGGINYGIQG